MRRHHLFYPFLLLLLFPLAVPAQTADFFFSFTPNNSSIAQGGRTTASININGATSDYTPVTLAVSQGLPAGISVDFSPGSCIPPCNSLMTVMADTTAPPGTYSIPVIGAALGQTASAAFTITIVALPKFDYSISLTSSDGFAATREKVDTTMNLEQLAGTSDYVILSASGQPSGVSVSFSPASCAPPCSALITFDVSLVTSGVYPIIISATAGSITKKAIYNLRVVPSSLSDFSLSVFPPSNTIKKKDSVNALVNITQLSGTSQDVTLTVANQPASTTVQVIPNSCQPPCNATLSISTDESVRAGSYQIVILGYSGGFTKSIAYNLVITESSSLLGSELSGYIFSRSLSRGSRGDDVTRLQQYLATDPALYPEGLTSGYYGSLTEKAVGRFQIKYGIVVNSNSSGWGTFGPRTRAKANSLLLR